MAKGEPSFLIANVGALKRRGLTGYDIRVRLTGETLTFTDESKRTVAVPAERVDRLRHFRMDATQSRTGGSTPTIYETKIWWDGNARPILIVPFRGHKVYRAALRTFARQVAETRGLDRIRLGPGYVTAIVNLLLVGPIVLALIAYAFYVAVQDGGWWWVAAIAVFIVFGALAGGNIISRWPRRVRSLEQLDSELP